MKVLIALLSLGLCIGSFGRPAPNDRSKLGDVATHAAAVLPCASGGPVSEAFYESMYQRCLGSYCPSLCSNGGNAHGDYYTNGFYQIVCNCY